MLNVICGVWVLIVMLGLVLGGCGGGGDWMGMLLMGGFVGLIGLLGLFGSVGNFGSMGSLVLFDFVGFLVSFVQ